MSEQNQQQPVFSLDKIYVKDVSVEIPNAPKIFLNRDQPNVDLNLNFQTEKVEDGIYQTTLQAVVSAKVGSEQMFLIEVHQAGIFQMRNIPEDQLNILHNVECPNILFPYLREVITDLSTRAGFAPVILSPVNFAFLFQQKQQAQTEVITNTIN